VVKQQENREMSQISMPQTEQGRDRPAGRGLGRVSISADRRTLALRMRVAARRHRLTGELADGADPCSSPERSLRAAQLTSTHRRRQLARTLRRIVHEAHHPPLPRWQVVSVNRTAVLDAEEAIDGMIARLRSADPVRAEGMAIAERMITDADTSPLYNRTDSGTLRRVVLIATEALDPAPEAERELAIAA
jgi:hypothetical protein